MALLGQVLLRVLVRDLIYRSWRGRLCLLLQHGVVRLQPTWIDWIEWIEIVWVHANLPRPKLDRSKFSTSAPKAGGGEFD
ncbi:hypothetical protein [Bradyrhizobium sp. CCGUVB23]|uniref:hypothetical protein n=1 Tax=Bradyrhizobium sp. CCGUVB23 TaxID=2949630 RepID=UPI0020B2CFE3|nr:hypothetical protein [Bradyrhizobium sp. CCGUVB23]MCP3463566.1 hypothetical protein [Bradyrhizobium sp. CCGUVB23]